MQKQSNNFNTLLATVISTFKKPLFLYSSLFCLILYYSDLASIRPFWYDESLTITEFVSLPNYLDVYRYYQIANNHIIYNLILKLWIQIWELVFPFSEIPFRLLSFIFALFTIVFMWLTWRRRYGFWPALIVVLCFITSLIFPIYSVAVRGYMFSILVAMISLWLAERVMLQFSMKRAVMYFVLALLLVGTTPSNLFYLGALACLFWPKSFTNRKELKSWLVLCTLPVFAFIIFYLPIFDKLLNIAKITHGWKSPCWATVNYYLPIILMLLPVFPFLIYIVSVNFKRKAESYKHISTFIHLVPAIIPLMMMFLRQPSPFPRVFLVFYPIYLLWLVSLMNKLLALARKRYKRNFADCFGFYLCILVIGVGAIWHNLAIKFSSLTVSATEQDDTISPYFMNDYNPRQVMAELKKMYQVQPFSVLINNSADPPSLMLYSRFFGLPEQMFLFDKPREKLDFTRQQIRGALVCIVRDKQELEILKNRFKIDKFKHYKDLGFHKLFFAE